MGLNLFAGKKKEEKLSLHLDPFKKSCVKRISMTMTNMGNYVWIRAKISMENNNTNAEQVIEADDFPTLVKKVQDFIESLE